jgi:hypothetical protein
MQTATSLAAPSISGTFPVALTATNLAGSNVQTLIITISDVVSRVYLPLMLH